MTKAQTVLARAISLQIARRECRGILSVAGPWSEVTPDVDIDYGCIFCGVQETHDGKIAHIERFDDDKDEAFFCPWLAARRMWNLP